MSRMKLTQMTDWDTLAGRIHSILPQKDTATVIALHGDLGAGKTTFVHALARRIGVTDYVTSPTFVIMKQYVASGDTHFQTLIHIDAYRIEALEELALLRLDELFSDPHNLICIEWAGRIADVLPDDRLEVKIAYDAPTGIRQVTYEHTRN